MESALKGLIERTDMIRSQHRREWLHLGSCDKGKLLNQALNVDEQFPVEDEGTADIITLVYELRWSWESLQRCSEGLSRRASSETCLEPFS
jgi:hypothetical protein